MNPQQVLAAANDALSVRRVFGDPIQVDGVTVVPAARISGGGGGKGAEDGGAGFGLNARPAGVYVIRDGDARWRPAVDVNRIVLGGQLIALAAILSLAALLKRWRLPRPEDRAV
jgi:uncharacterized spore protein YtfJ